MDENVCFNIIKFADNKTALSFMKAGGLSFFDAAKSNGTILEIDYTDKTYFEVTIQIMNKSDEEAILNTIRTVFQIDSVLDEWYCEEVLENVANMHKHEYNAAYALKYRPYSSVVLGKGTDIYISSTKREVFLTGLLYLGGLNKNKKIRYLTGARLSIDKEKWESIAKDWFGSKESGNATRMKNLNVRLSPKIVLPVMEIYYNNLSMEEDENKLLGYQPELDVEKLTRTMREFIANAQQIAS